MDTVFAIILAIAALRGPVSDTETDRLLSMAEDLWSNAAESTLMCGDAAQTATALALAAVAVHESGLRADVQDCRACYRGSPWCDRGKSISAFQLHERGGAWLTYSREAICGSNDLATRLALRVLERHRHASTIDKLMAGYARGGTTWSRAGDVRHLRDDARSGPYRSHISRLMLDSVAGALMAVVALLCIIALIVSEATTL